MRVHSLYLTLLLLLLAALTLLCDTPAGLLAAVAVDPLALLRFRDLVSRNIVNNRMTLRRWMAAGIFPRPIVLTRSAKQAHAIAWRARDVQDWLDERVAASKPDEAA